MIRPFLEREFENTVCVLEIMSVQNNGRGRGFMIWGVLRSSKRLNIGTREMADQEGLELGEFILKEESYVRVFIY